VTLTVITLAKNEEHNIKDCLASTSFADEVIVIDDCSDDRTAEIAAAMGAKVHRRAMNGDYAAQYNFAVDQAGGDWIMIVDADERVTPELQAAVREVIARGENAGYEIPHINYIFGEPMWHGGWYPNYGLRLFPRGTVRHEGLVHSRMVHSLPIKRIDSPYIHYPYATWDRYFKKFDTYTTLTAKEKLAEGQRVNFFNDLVLRPLFAFVRMYILKSGWRDGRMGFIMAAFHGFYTMTKYAKLYTMAKEREPKA
jgi:glycosyltransferase involved in cell wall biosynthesis